MDGITILVPGHVARLCADCVHRTGDLSHVSPCSKVAWQGARHVAPTLKRWDIDQAVTCSDFAPAEPDPGRGGNRYLPGALPRTAPPSSAVFHGFCIRGFQNIKS